MSQTLLDQFKQRYNRAMQISYLWASLHEACYFYAIPNRNRFWRPKEQQGEAKGTRVYDTTAIEATKTFVSKLHTAMTPPQTQWGFLTIDPEFDEDDAGISRDDAQRLLNDYMRKLFEYIHDSNFDLSLQNQDHSLNLMAITYYLSKANLVQKQHTFHHNHVEIRSLSLLY